MDDPLEREADRVAEAVVSGSATPAVQRTYAAGEEEEDLQRSATELPTEDEEEKLQTKRSPGTAPEVSPKTASRIATFRGGGEALSPTARSYFEPRFGRDLASVRLHTGAEAATAAREVQARAFTVGSDIAFGAGEYRPETQEGKKLLAHELTHTLQQSASPGSGAGVVRRTVPPRRSDDKPPPLSRGAQRIREDLIDIIKNVVTSPSPYTRGTKKALQGLRIAIDKRLVRLEERKLSPAAKILLRAITAVFVKELKDAVARPPEDPDQGDDMTIEIWEIRKQWNRAFKELLEKLEKQPPLELAKQEDEDSGQRLA